jgi:hypothetical protein
VGSSSFLATNVTPDNSRFIDSRDIPGLFDALLSESQPLDFFEPQLHFAFGRLWANLSHERREVLRQRTLCPTDRSTLHEIGKLSGVTRERVRQIENSAKDRIVKALKAQIYKPLADAARVFRRYVGDLKSIASLSSILDEGGLIVGARLEDDLKFNFLLWLSGPYELTDGWISRGPLAGYIEKSRAALGQLMASGPVAQTVAIDVLRPFGMSPDDSLEWIEQVGGYRIWRGYIMPWDNNIRVRTTSILQVVGEPMTVDDLHRQTNLSANVRSFTQQILANPNDFTRVGPRSFGLAMWGKPGYTSIADSIAEAINERGGDAAVSELVDSLTTKFDVSPTSVRAYLASPRFKFVQGGRVRLRHEVENTEITIHPPAATAGMYVHDGGWYYRIAVTPAIMLGNGIPVPTAVAGLLELKPMSSVFLTSEYGEVRVSWSTLRVHLGSLASVVSSLGLAVGDYLFVGFHRDRSVRFRSVANHVVEAAQPLDRATYLVGSAPTGSNEGNLIEIARSLDLKGSEAEVASRVVRKLRTRNEWVLAELIPTSISSVRPNNGAAFDEILGASGLKPMWLNISQGSNHAT